ncbi:HD domain-containing protein [Kitasatospora sp. NPDC088548]|uniref:HD domain-containing protein n=1 Tax=Kitasatospora sp. NPDC088548 TaxID=3364075 RepID=UPI00380F982C
MLDVWTAECGMDGALAVLRTVRLPQPAQVLLTGLVIMADWIASNPELFPYFPEERPRSEAERVTAAWRGLQLPPLWEPSEPQGTAAGLLLSRFDLPPTARPRPVQEQAVALTRELPSPGLMVIEAPMGEGKTEAALAVAEIFAARCGAGGCFVALPTRATSNVMFSRLTTWLDHLPGNGERAVFLAHAKASLHDEYARLMRAGRRQIEAVDVDGPHHSREGSHEDGNGDGDKDGRARQRPGGGRHPQSRNAGLIAHQWLPPTARSACAVC